MQEPDLTPAQFYVALALLLGMFVTLGWLLLIAAGVL